MFVSMSAINFYGKPGNYAVVDNCISRSAQPQKEDFIWLKEQGVTDIFNFRTMTNMAINFDEGEVVRSLGLRYHHIPSKTAEPSEVNVLGFLKGIEAVKARGGKAHLHCMAGADRTGMYTFIYKMINGIDTKAQNLAEWFEHGFHYKRYPHLIEWTEQFLAKAKK